MRVFIGLDIDEQVRERISRFMESVRFVPDARWVRVESLHVTLKFLGEQSIAKIEEIKRGLSTIHQQAFQIRFREYGFFPNPKAARVFWIGIESGPELASLANGIESVCSGLGIPRDEHRFSPHLTLARTGSGSPRRKDGDSPNRRFQHLQEKLAPLSAPEFGTMAADAFYLYESQPGPGGSRYSKLARFPLE